MPDTADPTQSASGADPSALLESLEATFREQVARAVGAKLDGLVTSLAFVDHYLSKAREETRAPIVTLVAAGAGAYLAGLVERELGAVHVGPSDDPRRVRTMLTQAFVFFSPVDLAYEAIAGKEMAPDDERIAAGPPLDTAFHLDETPGPDEAPSPAAFIRTQLANSSPVAATEFHSLTCRFETLTYIVELLAHHDQAIGRPPRTLGVKDYLAALTRPAPDKA